VWEDPPEYKRQVNQGPEYNEQVNRGEQTLGGVPGVIEY
jgi:hypothetical protein